ncbi:hypothetical protein PVAP13_2NG131103 [Panicum virgatum]|uniref:Uncharacterized protein n=1 Tax=Panicum virgatum TaxID=38727 RepID=A0A8T0VMK6_PANVG|nr:hypothetical protein PVAP13_2NG131103 [Panicum virgatum]
MFSVIIKTRSNLTLPFWPEGAPATRHPPPTPPPPPPSALQIPDPHRLLPRPHESLHTRGGNVATSGRFLLPDRSGEGHEAWQAEEGKSKLSSESPPRCAAVGWFLGCVGR